MKETIINAIILLLICIVCGCAPKKEPIASHSPETFETQSLKEMLAQNGKMHPNVFGLGLTYQDHVDETTGLNKPDIIPVFSKKTLLTFGERQKVPLPTPDQMIDVILKREGGLEGHESLTLPVLVDYEIELGLFLLEAPDWDRLEDPSYTIQFGYFLVNDLSLRNIAMLGEGTGEKNKFKYWGDSKGFLGFLPVGDTLLIPHTPSLDKILKTKLVLTKNGQIVQSESTDNLLFSIRELLQQMKLAYHTRDYPESLPGKGDLILTGTPGGVAIGASSKFKRVMADIFGIDRHKRLMKVADMAEKLQQNNNAQSFLKSGDVLVMDGGVLGRVRMEIVAQ